MNRTEFLTILRNQFAGQMQEGKAEAHIRYYEDYIQSQVRKGRTEEDVLGELGDPRLIAKTLIETEDSQPQAGYGQYSSYGSGVEEVCPAGEKMEEDPGSFHLAGKGSGDRRRGPCHDPDPAGYRSGASILYCSGDRSFNPFLD